MKYIYKWFCSYSGGGEDRLGGVYWKAKYVEYTDERFYTEKLRTTSEEHLGMLGKVYSTQYSSALSQGHICSSSLIKSQA